MKEKIREEIELFGSEHPSLKGKADQITKNLFALSEYTNSQKIMLYVSLPNEVDTSKIMENSFSSKKVFFPITNTETRELELGQAENMADLREGAHGILEPIDKTDISPAELDLVIIPGRAFDTSGNRIGRGKGYYDRFLSKVSCPKIALAFEYQIIDEVPSDLYDIPVDKIVTEERVIQCSP